MPLKELAYWVTAHYTMTELIESVVLAKHHIVQVSQNFYGPDPSSYDNLRLFPKLKLPLKERCQPMDKIKMTTDGDPEKKDCFEMLGLVHVVRQGIP